MKKAIAILLSLLLLLSAMPAAFADGGAVWSGTGNRIVADITPDNTKSYILSYDLTMPGVLTASGTNQWPDEALVFLRDVATDSYLMLRHKTYINGSGKYQVACAAQLWNGSGWNSELFVWSGNYDTPVSELHMELSHNAATHEMTWTLTSGENLLSTKKVDASYMTEALKHCTACELALQRSSNAITPSNTKIEYTETPVEDDELGAEVHLTAGEYYMADTAVDNTKSYVINYDLLLPAIAGATSNGNFYDSVQMFLRNATDDDYIYFRNQTFRDGSGGYQVSADSQVWNGAARTWSEQTFVWSQSKPEPVTKAHMRVTWNAAEELFGWTLTDGAGALLNTGSVDPGFLTNKLTNCAACEFKFKFLNGASVENVYLKYAETEQPSEGDVTLSDTSAVWTLSDGFKADDKDTALYLTKVNAGSPTVLIETIDVQKGFELSFDWHIDGTIDSNDTYGGKLNLMLQAPGHNGYVFLRLVRYRNGGGKYQVWCSAQYLTDAGSWSNNVIASWGSKADNGVLNDVNVKLSRNPELQALTVELTDKSDDGNMLKTNMAIGGFDSSDAGNEFAANLLSCAAASLQVKTEGDNTCLWHITDPVIGECKVIVNQNLFTLSGVWEAGTDENGYCYKMTKQGAGWVEYNARLDAAAGIDFTYDILPEEFADGAAGSLLRLRCSENPETYFFARIWLTAAGQYKMQGQLYNSSASPEWTDLITVNDWNEGVTGSGVRVHVYTSDGKLYIAFSNLDNTGLRTFAAEGLPADFFTCETLQLMLGSESGNGKHILSNFRGLPEIYSPDKRSVPFTKAVFAFDGTVYGDTAWQTELCADILEYQNTPVETARCAAEQEAILAAGADLIVLPGWTMTASALSGLLTALKAEAKTGAVLVVCGKPYDAVTEAADAAEANAAIRETALAQNVLYADLYNALRSAPWTVGSDGVTPGAIGSSLIAGAVLKELLRSCSCLAVNATAALKISASAPIAKTEAALDAFRNADTVSALKAAVEDAHLGLDLDIYHNLTGAQQTDVLTRVLAEYRENIMEFAEADALFNRFCMLTAAAEDRSAEGVKFTTYVAVGDSISVGETSVNKSKDGWVPHFAKLISDAQGREVTLINKAISGTRMCTVTDNGMFPPAVQTVQSYIVANNPDLLTVAYGINDYHAGTTLEEFISTYGTYLTEVTEACPDTLIIVCGLCAKGGDADSRTLQTWNSAIRRLAENFGLIFCETYYDMRGIEWLLTDGLHPTNAGYRVMANALFRTLCGKVNLGETLEQPCDHTYAVDADRSVPATCLEAGSDVYVCGKCGASYSEPVNALGHDYIGHAAQPATCLEGGWNAYQTCSRCDYTSREEINPLGHQFENGVCLRCGAEDPDAKDPCEGYTDINRNLWYHSAADFVIRNGYMGSTKTDALTFEPNTKVSRAMVASIMYRIAGTPAVEYRGTFTDVKAGKWFTDAVEWAAQNGLAAGKGDGRFDPNGNVTRQELAVFMCKLAAFLGKDVSVSDDLSAFKDANKVPVWAKTYMQWAVAAGLISGKGQKDGTTLLAPVDNATRAEFASIIMRFAALN